jgi:hypothetical protein
LPVKISNFDTDYQFKKKEEEFEDYSEKIADELAKSAYQFDDDSEEEK